MFSYRIDESFQTSTKESSCIDYAALGRNRNDEVFHCIRQKKYQSPGERCIDRNLLVSFNQTEMRQYKFCQQVHTRFSEYYEECDFSLESDCRLTEYSLVREKQFAFKDISLIVFVYPHQERIHISKIPLANGAYIFITLVVTINLWFGVSGYRVFHFLLSSLHRLVFARLTRTTN